MRSPVVENGTDLQMYVELDEKMRRQAGTELAEAEPDEDL